MMNFVLWYLSVGVAIYLICLLRDAITGFKTFKKADIMDIIRGFIGALIWPYVIWELLG